MWIAGTKAGGLMKRNTTPPGMVTAILKLARERLAKRGGWQQGGYGFWEQEQGPVCAVGAIKYARAQMGLNPWLVDWEEVPQEMEYLLGCLPVDAWSIAMWNDKRQRKKKEVLAAFDCAIETSQRV